MKTQDEDRIQKLLRQSLPPMQANAEPNRDLWPAVLQRLGETDAQPMQLTRHSITGHSIFDWALLACVVAFVAFFPASLPMLLYYL